MHVTKLVSMARFWAMAAWVVAVMAAYLWQFRSIFGAILTALAR